MLQTIGVASLDELINQTVPASIRLTKPLAVGQPRGEHETLVELRQIAGQNQVWRSLMGMGYHATITPAVIRRNILENPGWYTQYTPYQAEISQGRLEALLNFQTMISDLTGLPLANASLLDEGTAAAEAMAMCRAITGRREGVFLVSGDCHPQTIAVVRTRAESMGISVRVGDVEAMVKGGENAEENGALNGKPFGVLLQYPTTRGGLVDYGAVIERVHEAGGLVVMAADLLALTLVKSPGEWGADIAVGSAQRFGVPMGFGGPHAAFMATKSEYVRKMPGRLVGVSKDAAGNAALRLAVQTREQHIRRDKATSNICTAQVLLAIMAGMYAVYHGPVGLRRIATRVALLTATLAEGLRGLGHGLSDGPVFDTLHVRLGEGYCVDAIIAAAGGQRINLRDMGDGGLCVSLDERSTSDEVEQLLAIFATRHNDATSASATSRDREGADDQPHATSPNQSPNPLPDGRDSLAGLLGVHARQTPYLTHPVFNSHHSETRMLRYIKRLESRDLSLCQSMISLGSCTMKLNGSSEMLPITWPEFAELHPFAPVEQTRGYAQLIGQLESWLAEITGFAATSLQPNAGSQGEYAGLMAIRAYHHSRGDTGRDVCLIPVSAHGTNPASAVIAGFNVVAVACDAQGNIDVADLSDKAAKHADKLAAIMLTYPSTHGVFEEAVRDVCRIVHQHGGQVYMDGANMNAQVGLCKPGTHKGDGIGADVCHLNLHKTFCIPHGGGGPGVGPICVAAHLVPFLPSTTMAGTTEQGGSMPLNISAAPYGSASILPIPWVYIRLMGAAGLTRATEVAILNANYIAARLDGHYPTLYRGKRGRVAHECIIDCRAFEGSAGIRVEDIAKRLMDYGFHAPTMSWPVPGTLMIEPTESESQDELDRFCEALIAIRHEIRDIEEGRADRDDNALKHAPHTALVIGGDKWEHAYGREQAAFPAEHLRQYKFWPAVGRIDNAYGDRNLVCTCEPLTLD